MTEPRFEVLGVRFSLWDAIATAICVPLVLGIFYCVVLLAWAVYG